MIAMFQLRGVQKLNQVLQSTTTYGRSRHTVSLLLRDSPRHFSTENELPSQQSQPPPQSQSPPSSTPIDSFLYQPSASLVYGKLSGISVNTLKTDIINLFDLRDLTSDDIKVDYNWNYYPMAMFVQFSSMSSYNAGMRELLKKNRAFRLEKVDRRQWDLVTPYNGRYALFQGIPRLAIWDDVERLLSGCNYDSSSLEVFTRSIQNEPLRMAKVRFPSQVEAMNAVIRKNGAFCLNSRITVRLIQ